MNNYYIVISCGKEGLPRLPIRKAPGKNFFLHTNLPSAYAEATRLAGQHHGIKFGVFEWLGAVVHEDSKIVDVSIKVEVP